MAVVTTFESGLRFVCFFSQEIEMERRVLFYCLLLIFAFLGYCNSQGELIVDLLVFLKYFLYFKKTCYGYECSAVNSPG